MDHIYSSIEGWFNFQHLYTNMVLKAVEGSKFVEIGTWKGKVNHNTIFQVNTIVI